MTSYYRWLLNAITSYFNPHPVRSKASYLKSAKQTAFILQAAVHSANNNAKRDLRAAATPQRKRGAAAARAPFNPPRLVWR